MFWGKRGIRRSLAVAACTWAAVAAPQAGAQTPDAGSLLQTVPTSPARPGTMPTIEDRIRTARPIADIEGLKVEIKRFELLGLTVIAEAAAQAVLEPYLGPDKKFQDLLDAAAALKKLLAGKGYFLADAIIPEQSLKDGSVTIMVLEGRMGKIRVETAPDVGIAPAHIERFFSSLQEGSIIQTAVIERAIFLLSDLKGVTARTIFEPGDKIGTANLTVQVSRGRAIEGNLDFDANGSIYTGVMRLGAGVDFNNPMGIGDMLSLRYSRSAASRDLEYQRVSYLAPVGVSGLKLGFAYSDLAYRLGTELFIPIKASGKASVKSALVAYPLVRSRNTNLILAGQLDYRTFRDRLDATNRFTDKNSEVTSLGLGGDVRDAWLGGGVNVYNVSHTRGTLIFADPALLAADKAGRNTNGAFEKTNISFSRLQSISEGLAFYFSYSQQLATKNLDSSEKFSLGGQNTVRAYPQGEASGDEGWVASGEFRFRIPTGETLPGTLVFTLFHDAGWARLNKNMLTGVDLVRERKLAGVGIGLNWEVPGDWSLRTSISDRKTAAPEAEHIKRDPRIYFSFSKNL